MNCNKLENWNKLEAKTIELRKTILQSIEDIEKKSIGEERVVPLSEDFLSSRRILKENPYDILVCGEVKKGKSSLLNAIIGKDILPVDNDIATSQVFRITNTEEESYALVFTDGSTKSISLEELSKFGSQIEANLNGEAVFGNKNLDYIQVNIPIAFLPEGVSLVDTPGLGAIYKSHESITQNYVSRASAVIFVLDPDRPIVIQEKEFIEKILDITPYILFVMTKVDLYQETTWRSQLERNSKLLSELFSRRDCPPPQILPISSKNLRAVSNQKDEIIKEMNLESSYFLEFKDALLTMMYKAVGLLYTTLPLKQAESHIRSVYSKLNDLMRANTASTEEMKSLIAEKNSVLKKIQEDWGDNSDNRKNVQNDIIAICQSVPKKVQKMTSKSGAAYKNYQNKIDSIDSMHEVEEISKQMPKQIVNEIEAMWRNITSKAQNQVNSIIKESQSKIDVLLVSDFDFEHGELITESLKGKEVFDCYKNNYISASIVSGLGVSALYYAGIIAAGSIAIPIALVIPVIWAWISGTDDAQRKAIEKNKAELSQSLVKLLNDISSEFLHIQEDGIRSLVDEFTFDLKTQAEKAIVDIVEKQKEKVRLLQEELKKESQKVEEEREAEVSVLKKIKAEWVELAKEVSKAKQLHKEISEALKV